jgi:hypothetical protein
VKETLDPVLQAGALGILALILVGVFYVVMAVLPSIRAFFDGLTALLREIAATQAVLVAKVDANTTAIGKVSESVQAEAFEVRQELGAAERRMAAVVRREQASERPPAPSARFSPAPNAPRSSRGG